MGTPRGLAWEAPGRGPRRWETKRSWNTDHFPTQPGLAQEGGGHTPTQPRCPSDLRTPWEEAAPSPTGAGDPLAIVGVARVPVREQPPGGVQGQPGHP